MMRSWALCALFIHSILALQPSPNTEGQVSVYMQDDPKRNHQEGFVNTAVESRSTDTKTDTHDAHWRCLRDPIDSYPKAMALMVLFMALVIGLGFACMLVTNSAERSRQNCAVPSPPQMFALDLARVVIIADIIFYHFTPRSEFIARSGLGNKDVGLDGLLVISGFVLVMSADTKTGNFDVPSGAAFLIRRLARLCPGYYMALGLAAAVGPPYTVRPYIAWPLDALFLKALMPLYDCKFERFVPFAGMAHGWFVSMVVIHTPLFPFVYNLMKKQVSSWRPFVCVFISVVGLRWGSSFLNPYQHWVSHGKFALGYRLLVFFMGMLSAQLTSMVPRGVLLHKGWWFILIVSLPLALDLKILQPWFRLEGIGFVPAPVLMWSVVVIAARCVAEQSAMEQSRGETSNIHVSWVWQVCGLSSQFMTFLAKHSYGAYVYQYLAKDLLHLAWRKRPSWAGFLIVVVAWLLAVLSEHFVEKPIVRAIEVQLRKRTISDELGAGITKD